MKGGKEYSAMMCVYCACKIMKEQDCWPKYSQLRPDPELKSKAGGICWGMVRSVPPCPSLQEEADRATTALHEDTETSHRDQPQEAAADSGEGILASTLVVIPRMGTKASGH